MTRKSGPRRLDHWLAGSDRAPKATGDHPTRSAQHPAVGTYVMAARTGSLLFVSDHGAIDGGRRTTPVGWARSSPPPKAAWRAEAVTADLLANLKVEVGDLSPSHRSRKSWSTPPRTTPNNTSSQIDATDLLVLPSATASVGLPDPPSWRRTASGSPWKSRTSSMRRLNPAATPVRRLTLGS
jgi:hypothetical protein